MTTLNREIHQELTELIEDSVEYFCDHHMMSGEILKDYMTVEDDWREQE